MPSILPTTPTETLEFLPKKTRAMLEKAGLPTIDALLHHYPRRYEDRRHFAGFPQSETGEAVCLHAEITDCQVRRVGYRKYVEIRLEDATGSPLSPVLHARWFNMPWIIKAFAAGQTGVFYGKLKDGRSRLVMDHPDFEIIDPAEPTQSLHMGRVVPVYPLSDGLLQKPLREAMGAVLEKLEDRHLGDVLPETVRPRALPTDEPPLTRAAALRTIHFPATLEAAARARRHLALEEFFALQLNVLVRRRDMIAQLGFAHEAPGKLLDRWRASLPFALTAAQERSIAEVRADMRRPRPMNRLLQGDVGSGKTFVALAAALLAVEAGRSALIMAPTQVLAEQHYLNFQRHLAPLGVRVGLRTAARQEEKFLPLLDGGERPQILVGTHALLFDKTSPDPGLVVIDEQHKFGVAQRAKLLARGTAPDVLVMTATPIPRTLALTVYGDLDVSVLDELPAGRGKLITAVRAGVDLRQVIAFTQQQLAKGRQAYIVYPLVEESDKLAVKAATTEHQHWQERLPGVTVGLMHGRLKPEEKDAVMAAYRAGTTQVLVSTTVIEVGVDVANANLMLVFNAERFGLAQLHQLRGRVGRGAHTSYCVLICSDHAADAVERLKILEHTRDGFAIAEADLQQRGPGELLGSRQSGVPGLRLGDLAADAPLVHEARALAAATLEMDASLQLPAHRHLRALLQAPEADVAQN